ncbi:hypothetical protein [Rheinheimera baltica]|uniref:hypothetical protein n=1 Tax=Rheinheimera baltica TaxID=67576 RepID=UPI00041C0E4F|nr:hypothetical protein [Rheinheimera baltica]
MNIDIKFLDNQIGKTNMLFVGSVGLDQRWHQAISAISENRIDYVFMLESGDISDPEKLTDLENRYNERFSKLPIASLDAFTLWKRIVEQLVPLINQYSERTLIDISAINHESLLILNAILHEYCLSEKVQFIYVGAATYSNVISQGVKSIRSVLSYPGTFLPSKPLHHLVILVGFEFDRAKELIQELEPTSISLGIGTEAYGEVLFAENQRVSEKLQSFIESIGGAYRNNVNTFTFSCSDVLSAKNSILQEVSKYSNSNITLSPMNTKISTLAAGAAAIENDLIKLCYVEPLETSTVNVAKSGDQVTLFSFS